MNGTVYRTLKFDYVGGCIGDIG